MAFKPLPDVVDIENKEEQTASDAERARLLAIKQALLTMGTTIGWTYVKQMAQNIVNMALNDAIDYEDKGRAEMAWLEARAAKHIFEKLFATIESTTQFDPNINPPEWFENLSEWITSNDN